MWIKDSSFGPQLLRSPRLDLEALKASGRTLPSAIRQRLRTGTTSVPASELAPCAERERAGDRTARLPDPAHRRAPRLG